ncbi:MAG: sulfotransferase [Actinomycetia bacterium]|nr:sulfotransferase [Actinomycetes bacterium]
MTSAGAGPPVMVLGVSRSGTTLLKEMLDRHSSLAIPSESYFIPQLWSRHGARPVVDRMLDDLGRLERIRQWGIEPDAVRERIGTTSTFAEVIRAVYEVYAEARGKARYGDKTPAYMRHLRLLDHVFPQASYVHIVRDGRDAGRSFLSMQRRPPLDWSRPRGLSAFACQWRDEVERARLFGRAHAAGRYLELRYEDVVAEPGGALRSVCAQLELEYEPEMLTYHERIDEERLLDHPRLSQPPTPRVRSWREELPAAQVERFEAVAGELLSELGYERAYPSPTARARARALICRRWLSARQISWRAGLSLVRRTPLWRARQVYIRRSS